MEEDGEIVEEPTVIEIDSSSDSRKASIDNDKDRKKSKKHRRSRSRDRSRSHRYVKECLIHVSERIFTEHFLGATQRKRNEEGDLDQMTELKKEDLKEKNCEKEKKKLNDKGKRPYFFFQKINFWLLRDRRRREREELERKRRDEDRRREAERRRRMPPSPTFRKRSRSRDRLTSREEREIRCVG